VVWEIPLRADALNVTGSAPYTTPPPHNAPHRLERDGDTVSDSVTLAEYRSACASCAVPAGETVCVWRHWLAFDPEEQAGRA
jgi:hypothetical protein